MPIWAIVYCVMIALSGLLVLTMYKTMPSYWAPGQILSSVAGVLMFVFYYDIYIAKPESVWVVLAMICYSFYWEVWENRRLFPKLLRPGEIISESESPTLADPFYVGPSGYVGFWAMVSLISLPMLFIVAQLLLSYR